MTTRTQTSNLLLALRDGYPNLFTESGDQWASRVAAYHKKLGKFDYETVKAACDAAPDKYPDRFPTAGQLASIAIGIEEVLRRSHQEKEDARRQAEEDKATADWVTHRRNDVIPSSPEDQEAWIKAVESPFDQMARRFEVESKNGNFNPNQKSPPGVGERRAREIVELLEAHGAFCDPFCRPREPGSDDDLEEPGAWIAAENNEPGDDCPL